MRELGFDYVISEEDTGTGDKIHRNGSSTEWWVSFYKSNRIAPADDLPHGFLASDRREGKLFSPASEFKRVQAALISSWANHSLSSLPERFRRFSGGLY